MIKVSTNLVEKGNNNSSCCSLFKLTWRYFMENQDIAVEVVEEANAQVEVLCNSVTCP
jgi:hypothetical protein